MWTVKLTRHKISFVESIKRKLKNSSHFIIIIAVLITILYTIYRVKKTESNDVIRNGRTIKNYKLVDINGFYDKIIHPKKKKRGAPKSIGTQIFDRLKQTGRPLETDLKQTDWQEARDKVKEMMQFAWSNYKKYAWGQNELRPLSKTGHQGGIFGEAKFGATILDSLSTLHIMGLMAEFNEGRTWVEEHFNPEVDTYVSVFETNIRVVGGLLSAYALSGDTMFLWKAEEMANLLLPAFNTTTGLPRGMVNLKTGESKPLSWSHNSILSEIGTLHLEFVYLSNLTEKPVYKEKVKKVRDYLDAKEKMDGGLYPNYINPDDGSWGSHSYSLGALGDSFYEYLLKSWLQTGKTDAQARRMYDEAAERISEVMFTYSSPSNLLYVANRREDSNEPKMEHLACFAGGMFMLGAEGSQNASKWRTAGEELAKTCHETYARTQSGIGPERFSFQSFEEAKGPNRSDRVYLLRPEVIETWFYMWRFTKDNKYRQWAKAFYEALEKHCRTANGFSGLVDVDSVASGKDDVQQSFFLAETLKYLYLIFSEDDVLPLDDWVFNTEAHPLPVIRRTETETQTETKTETETKTSR